MGAHVGDLAAMRRCERSSGEDETIDSDEDVVLRPSDKGGRYRFRFWHDYISSINLTPFSPAYLLNLEVTASHRVRHSTGARRATRLTARI